MTCWVTCDRLAFPGIAEAPGYFLSERSVLICFNSPYVENRPNKPDEGSSLKLKYLAHYKKQTISKFCFVSIFFSPFKKISLPNNVSSLARDDWTLIFPAPSCFSDNKKHVTYVLAYNDAHVSNSESCRKMVD